MNYCINKHGLQILTGVLDQQEIDAAIEAVDKFYAIGQGTRVVNLHMNEQAIVDIITKPIVKEFIEENCFNFPTVYTTLSFKYGTQQPIHRDVPHFLTCPKNKFIGVWYALEDTDLTNGCLEYYVGGHLIPDIDGEELVKELFPRIENLTDTMIRESMEEYQKRITEACQQKGLLKAYGTINKGDVLIWDALLPHGGSPIRQHGKTRKSIVAHCVPAETHVYNAKYFFNPDFDPAKLPRPKLHYKLMSNGWRVQQQSPAAFQGTYI